MRHDFPAEPVNNSHILTPAAKQLTIRYGADRWGRKEWIGKLYPSDTRDNQFLPNYVQHFNAIEFNATHYATYPREQIQHWVSKAEGRDFLFCPKVSQGISHYSSFKEIEDKTNAFLNSIYAFGKHLGPVLFQVGDRFGPKRKEVLFDYLISLPTDLNLFLEVRNPLWFEGEEYQGLLYFLRNNNIGLIINDSPGVNDCPDVPLLLDLTIPKCFIKYYPSADHSRLDQWFNKINEWGSKGLTEAYFFVHSNQDANEQLDELLYFKNLVEKR